MRIEIDDFPSNAKELFVFWNESALIRKLEELSCQSEYFWVHRASILDDSERARAAWVVVVLKVSAADL